MAGSVEVRQAPIGDIALDMPVKGIILWPLPFDQGTYPQLVGWALCDGTNGTPDMRGYFARGTPVGGDVIFEGGGCVECASAIGGCSTHDHACTECFDFAFSGCLPLLCDVDIQPANHLPPYKNLHFIMKL